MNTPTLETERLILRKFTGEDMEGTRKFYEERYAAKFKAPQSYAYAICLKSDNVPIGYIKARYFSECIS